MSTPAGRPAPKQSLISRALRHAIAHCRNLFEAEMRQYPAGTNPTPYALGWRRWATEYNALLKKIEPKRKGAVKPA
jgi:hypothetical protein